MNILITGASRGIGFACVKKWLEMEDCKIIALARHIAPLQALLAENPDFSTRLFVYEFDITQFEATENVKIWEQHFTHLDILVNNAALLINKSFINLSIAEWREVFEVNFFGAVKLTNALYPLLKKAGKAHVLNIGSMGGHEGSSKFNGLSTHATSKAALANLTECLAEEWKEDKIFVNCLLLGAVNTEMLAEAFPDYQAPLNPPEIADFITYFGLNGHRFLNGKLLPIALSTP